MDKIVANLHLWCGETDALNDTLELLISLVEKKERYLLLVGSKLWISARPFKIDCMFCINAHIGFSLFRQKNTHNNLS